MHFLRSSSLKVRIGLLIIGTIVLFEYALIPLYNYQRELLARVERLQGATARKQVLAEHQDQLQISADQARKHLALVQQYFTPDVADPQSLQLELQQKVEGLVRVMGARTLGVDWLPPLQRGVIQAPVRFRLELEPRELYQLLHALESDAHHFNIERIRLTARSRATDLTAELDIIAYGLAPQAGQLETPLNQ